MMRKPLAFLMTLIIILFGLPACLGTPPNTTAAVETPVPTVSPALDASATPLPQHTQGYALLTRTLYYPEGASALDAQYMLTYTLPAFDATEPAADAMNAAIALYEEELIERVNAERVPLADRAEGEIPYTAVTSEVTRARGYTNVILKEAACFSGEDQENAISAIVLDPFGNECSLAAASGIFDPNDLVAQQVYNAIDAASEAYYGDITLDDILLVLDLYNGFIVTGDGYDIYFPAGTLAPEKAGALTFGISTGSLYPDFVGEVLSKEEYAKLLPAINVLIASCAPYYESFAAGSPSAFVASAFLSRLTVEASSGAKGPYIEVAKDAYEALFSAYFTGVLPQDIAESGDGTLVGEASYSVPVMPFAAYSVRLDEASRAGKALRLSGMLLYGAPGSADSGELAPIAIELEAYDASPVGFRFVSLVMQ